MSDCLTSSRDGAVAWLTLNRPAVLNSLNRELLQALCRSLAEIGSDSRVRVAVITGAGERAFCAGADLTERKGMSEAEVIDYLNLIQKTMLAIEKLPKPVIAAINGPAFGGGTELALACDLRAMVESASLRLTEVKLGIIPGAGGTQRLARLVGKSKAKEMILTASPLAARQAFDLQLVHRLAPDVAGLAFKVSAWAQEIAANAPLALAQAKYAIDEGFDRDLAAGLALETKAYLQLINTRDRQEGLSAFAEKRQPSYVGE